jgi:hypothetical protein
LEGPEVIIQPPGINTNDTLSDLSTTKSTSSMSTKSANYVLYDKGDDNDNILNPLPVSGFQQG